MKKLIFSTIIAILLAGVAVALSLSNTADMETEPVKIGENHVAIAVYGWDKDGKRKLRGYSELYGLDNATAKWTEANIRLTNWSDPNWVKAHVTEQIADANDDVTWYQEIIDTF